MDMKNQIVKKNRKMLLASQILKKFLGFWIIISFLSIYSASWAQKTDLKTIVIDPGHGGVDVGAGGKYSREAMVALNIGLKLFELMKKEMPEINVLLTRDKDILPGNLSNKNAALRWRADFANQNNADLFISIHLNSTPSNQRWGKRQVGTKQETYYVTQKKGGKSTKVKKTRTVPVYERYRIEPTVYGTQTYVLASDWYKGKVASAGRSAAVKDYIVEEEVGEESPQLDPVEARIKAQQYAKYFFTKSLTLATYVEEEFATIGRKSMGVWQRDWVGAENIYVLTATQMPSILIETGFIDHPEDEDFLTSKEGEEQMARSILNAVKRYREVLLNPEKLIQQTETASEAK
jgi:N-acetylmuramoyl-L-alanine amidase